MKRVRIVPAISSDRIMYRIQESFFPLFWKTQTKMTSAYSYWFIEFKTIKEAYAYVIKTYGEDCWLIEWKG